MKRKIISIFLIVILLVISIMPIVYAKTAREKKEYLQDKLNDTKEEKENITKEKENILEQISKLDEQIDEYELEINNINTKINDLKNSIKSKETQIKKLEKEYKEKEEAFIERMVAIYEAGQTTYLDVLLSSEDIVSFISNYYMIEELAEADNAMLDSIQNQQQKIEDTKKELEEQKKNITNSKNEIEEKKEELDSVKASKQSKVNSLSEKEKKLQQEIEQYQEDIKDVEKQIKEYEKNNSSISYTGEKMGWPVKGYYSITSYYGYRIHPIYGYRKLHTGIDIGAPKNAKFVAAADGTVINASYSGGYGNRVIINHGNGISTIYAHGTSILVKEGQKVKKGQAVLTVGSTGLSTGNHAHFEVRKNGSYVNPLDYLE